MQKHTPLTAAEIADQIENLELSKLSGARLRSVLKLIADDVRRLSEVYVAVTVTDGEVTDLEALDCQPLWRPLAGQSFHVANINGGDSVPVLYTCPICGAHECACEDDE